MWNQKMSCNHTLIFEQVCNKIATKYRLSGSNCIFLLKPRRSYPHFFTEFFFRFLESMFNLNKNKTEIL